MPVLQHAVSAEGGGEDRSEAVVVGCKLPSCEQRCRKKGAAGYFRSVPSVQDSSATEQRLPAVRIVHLILTKRFAGSERYAIELANAQAARHQVAIILRRAAAEDRPDALASRVSKDVELQLVGEWRTRSQCERLIRRLKPDVVHAHLSAACKTLRGLRGECLRVATMHICYKPQQHKHLDALVAIAPWQLAAVDQRLRSHTVQIDNWTHPNVPDHRARARIRNLCHADAKTFLIGALGRVERSKGFDLLLDAFMQARGQVQSDVRLAIVGEGPELAMLRRRDVSGVSFHGFSPNPGAWLSAFDAFVSSAREEPFGLVFLEAMESGLPIIATCTNGALHLAQDMRPKLVPIEDTDALAHALLDVMQQRPLRTHYPMHKYRIDERLDAFDEFYERELCYLRPCVRLNT